MTQRIWTIGHSTRTGDELLNLLERNGIEALVDVRSFPGSRRRPQYNREEMERWVPEAGITYRHLSELGGRRKAQGVDPVVNGAWRSASFHNYADYALTPAFASGLAELCGIAVASRTAYLCSEALPWRCHRSLISTALVAQGWDVVHIMCDRNRHHELGQWGPDPLVVDGPVTYPAPLADATG